MILAIDVHYRDDTAYCVGVLFEWSDTAARQVLKTVRTPIEEYVPGEFYRRELPCLLDIIACTDQTALEAVIVDAHVYLDNQLTHGLGARLWEALDRKIPVIGLAKTAFHKNDQTTIPILRGASQQSLYVSAIGMDAGDAAAHIRAMSGLYRIPDILKKLDQLTKQE